MYQTIREQLYAASFAQDKQLYAIVDAARVEDMPAQLFELEDDPEYFSLFFETPQAELIDVAPYLVQLEMDSKFFSWLLTEGWGDSWGIFVSSDMTLEPLMEHFRSLLKVQSPEGEEFYFRFYDPRVLRVFLPTCDAGELLQVFGPVDSFILEDERPETLLRFTRVESLLATDRISL